MARDIKLNVYQHTKKKLQKMCELYKSKYAGSKFDPRLNRKEESEDNSE